jgi:predicted KAP-like P-loop ATPase
MSSPARAARVKLLQPEPRRKIRGAQTLKGTAKHEEKAWMTDLESTQPLGSDRPVTDPAEDAYGYAPFARRLARAVSETPSPEGLVIGIHGAWGTGKSALLNFVKHEITALAEEHRPIVIEFNPWWFEGQRNLAAQFLAQFSARLPQESVVLRQIGDVLAEYADAVGKILETTTQLPLVGKLSFVLKLLKRKAKDVPTLKAEISKALRKSGQRFVFVVDDIDRLTPDEVREIFKVVKALADFPNVIYLLAFDRKTIVEALEAAHRTDGEAYLEKIVQAPFSLPAIDRTRLRTRLQEDLGRLVDRFPGKEIDRTHWANVYMDGLDPYIQKPRDIVRVLNALTVTYPAVAGEVDTVDFIAMEFLRLFDSSVYETIREHRELFTGHSNDPYGSGRRDSGKAFHEAWLAQVPQERREHVRALVKRLFPRLQSIWGNMGYGSAHESIWRNALRVCSPEIFDVYFQFGVADDGLSRREFDQLLIAAQSSPGGAAQILAAAAAVRRPNGTSKARDYLDRIRDCDKELTPPISNVLVGVLATTGDILLSAQDEHAQGLLTMPNRWRILGVINHLLKHATPAGRLELTSNLIARGSIALAGDSIETVDELRAKPENAEGWALAEVGDELLAQLKRTWTQRLRALNQNELLATPELPFVLLRWIRWDDPQEVVPRVRPLFDSDDTLPLILEKYLRFGTRHVSGDASVTRVPLLNPKDFEPFVDIVALEPRVESMLKRTDLTVNQRLAGERYVWAMGQVRQGRDPSSMGVD